MNFLLLVSMVCCLLCTCTSAQLQDSTAIGSGADLSPHTVTPMQTVMPTAATTVHSALSPSPTPTATPEDDENPFLIFAKRVAIHRTNLNGTDFDTIISNSTFTSNAIAIDFDVRQNELFWTDVEERVIVRSNMDGSNATLLVNSDLSYPDGIAWDWLSKKLYWSDSEHREIEVLDPNSGDRMQLVETGLTTIPRDVAIDPNTRWLYWTDWGEVAKIERISMDGNNSTRKTLHSTDLIWPNALTVDYATQTLYWADAQLNKIESSSVDGSNRALLTTNLILHPFGITYHDGYLYWSDWQTDQITMTHVSAPDNVTVLVSTLDTEPMGLEVVTTSRQPISSSNPCSLNNGNCSHLCLLSSVGVAGYSCACPRGMVLAENKVDCTEAEIPTTRPPEEAGSCLRANYTSCCTSGDCLGSPAVCFCDEFCHKTDSCCADIQTTCPEPTSPPPPRFTQPYLLFANRHSINQMQLNGSDLLPLINTTENSIALDYNYREQYIYWTDVHTKTINQAKMDGSEFRVLISTNIGTPDGLACDWITNKIYWTDAATNTISVYDVDRGHRMQLFSLSTNSTPRAVVVDPSTRWLYWTDWGSPAKIERASMDGTQEQTIVNTGLTWPNGLTIDRDAQVLYWADASLDKIETSNVDGTNRRTILQAKDGIRHPFSIVFFNSTLYWSDWAADHIFSSKLIGSRSLGLTTLGQRLSTEPMAVQVISTQIQINVTNPCAVDNGNCSHLCLLSVEAKAGFSCACPNGYQMLPGNTQQCIAIVPPEPSPTTPPPPGSCRAAGYTTCCEDDACEGFPSLCFCDIYCAEFEDCCDDFYDICKPDGAINTTTSLPLPVPSPTTTTVPSLPTSTSVQESPVDNSVPVSSSPVSRTRTRSPSTSSSHPEPTSPAIIPDIIDPDLTESTRLVGVGTVAGSLVAAVLVIILIALMIVLLVILIIIRQRTLTFARYQNFENSSVKEMTMMSNGFKNQMAHEAQA